MRRHVAGWFALALVATAVSVFAGTANAREQVPAGKCARGQDRAAGGDICVARGNATAKELLAGVREVVAANPIRGVVFGVWIDGRAILTGALGEALPGAPATRRVNFRIGNTGEAIMTTALLRMVDRGDLSVDDPVAKWFPDLPEADAVTLRMLASSTSGYADFVTTEEFGTAFDANPFRQWTPAEVLAIAMKQPPLFAPGTSWAFSDTNFVLLGEIMAKASGMPYGRLIRSLVLDPVRMRGTRYTTTSAIPSPVLHAYSNERGKYEEATYWSPSWATHAATLTSNLSDMGRFARALGEGSLLTEESHELQVGDGNVGLGPLTEERTYGMGVGISHGWIAANPQVDGYTGIVSYYPPKKAAVVVFAAFAPGGDIGTHYAGIVFNRIGEILAPESPPNLTTCPRGGC
jgi:D-alanyl-D-alanine carboxypeptidase